MMQQRFENGVSRSPRLGVVLMVALVGLVLAPLSASAVEIPAGVDGNVTLDGTEIALKFIAAGWLGTGCDAVAKGTIVEMEGDPSASGLTGTEDLTFDWPPDTGGGFECHAEGEDKNGDDEALDHCIETIKNMVPSDLVDTVVERLTSGDLTPGTNPITIDIELVALSLVSKNPISVPGCNAGAGADFDLALSLDGAQGGGELSMKAGEFLGTGATGRATMNMEVNYQIKFTEVGNPSNTATIGGLSGDVSATGSFAAVPMISGWGQVAFSALLLGMPFVARRRK